MTIALVVDDSRTVRKFVGRLLKGLGFDVVEAANGEEALAVCRGRMPHLVMLDWHMPVMDGIDFIQELRALPDGSSPKVIFCTTENAMSQIAAAMEMGADEFIMKPFDQEILRLKLEEVGLEFVEPVK